MRHLSQREAKIMVVCIAAVTIYVGYSFVFNPLNAKLIHLDQEIETSEAKLTKYLKIIQRKPMIEEQYHKFSEYLKQESSQEKEMTSILSEIGSIASDIKLPVVDLKPRRVKEVDFYNNFSVSLIVDGEFLTIMQFLHILQNRPHLFGIEEVRLEKGSVRSANIKCRLVLSRALIP